uniref:Uncharacterized protein n=1 Tax=Rhizophora mucronata TaxID=61149 RepID=A0A2P2NEK5_RHIMU
MLPPAHLQLVLGGHKWINHSLLSRSAPISCDASSWEQHI